MKWFVFFAITEVELKKKKKNSSCKVCLSLAQALMGIGLNRKVLPNRMITCFFGQSF